jgi:uncharacterized membrane protein YkvA (DUF1232 family)
VKSPWKLLTKARHLLRHPEDLRRVLADALSKAYAKRTALIHVFEDFLLLFRLVKAWVFGEYKETPRNVILWAILAILYFLSPLDLFPDLFPGGYLDDIAFITFVINKIRVDLDKFQGWEKGKKGASSRLR